MALHELATNAAKFGALSVHGGKVDRHLAGDRRGGHAARSTSTGWKAAARRSQPPARQGFGTRLLESVLPGQIRAAADIDYAPRRRVRALYGAAAGAD